MQNNDRLVQLTDANGNDIYPVTINPDDIARIEMTQTDPGEGSPLAANHFVAVYGASSQVQTADIANNAVTSDKIDFTTLKKWVPDYANASSTNLWGDAPSATITDTGFVSCRIGMYRVNETAQVEIAVSGVIVAKGYSESRAPGNGVPCATSAMVPVSPGDTISYDSHGGALLYRECYFIPGKWV